MCDFDMLLKLKQVFILPEYQGCGYAQQAIKLAEARYPRAKAILQEEKRCCLYEKPGYRKTGGTARNKDGMDIVFCAKTV